MRHTGHHQAEGLFTGVSRPFRRRHGRRTSRGYDRKSARISFQPTETSRTPAGITHLDDASMNEFDGADVDASGRLADQKILGRRSIHGRRRSSADFPPEKLACRSRAFGGGCSYFWIFVSASYASHQDRGRAFAVGRIVVIAEHRILVFLRTSGQDHVMPVFGNMRQAKRTEGERDRLYRSSCRFKRIRRIPACGCPPAPPAIGLPVAGDAGYPTISPARTSNGTLVDHDDAATVLDGRLRAESTNSPGFRIPFRHAQHTRRPTISSASSSSRRFGGLRGRPISPRRMTETYP